MPTTIRILEKVVAEMRCAKPGWSFLIDEDDETGGSVFKVIIETVDNYNPSKPFRVAHCAPVPLTTYNEATWRRWVFDHCVAAWAHELGEAISFDGVRPFEPTHGPGENPYVIHEHRPDSDFLMQQDGSMKQSGPMR